MRLARCVPRTVKRNRSRAIAAPHSLKVAAFETTAPCHARWHMLRLVGRAKLDVGVSAYSDRWIYAVGRVGNRLVTRVRL